MHPHASKEENFQSPPKRLTIAPMPRSKIVIGIQTDRVTHTSPAQMMNLMIDVISSMVDVLRSFLY